MLKFLLIFVLIGVASCTTPRQVKVCQELDWYELGRRDGARGAEAQNVQPQQLHCEGSTLAQANVDYESGRNAGLVEFCSHKNAYEFGLSGQTYSYVCPKDLESQFLSLYRKGRRAYFAESQTQKL